MHRQGRIPPMVGVVVIMSAALGAAQSPADDTRLLELPAMTARWWNLDVTLGNAAGSRMTAGNCPSEISTHTNASFEGGAFFAQGGFAEGEIAAASYVLSPDSFPLRVDVIEMVFGTLNATQQTTTQWSVLVWEGPPNSGTLVAEFSSDGEILPHIILPQGTNGVNVAVSVDPGDPDQIIVTDNGSHTLSVGYRIDVHNQQTQNPCLVAPPNCCNAFPVVDTTGVASLTGNWLFGLNCGLLGCPANGGWANFQQLPGSPGTLCTPSGDWMIRATWTPLDCSSGEPGACCVSDGSCLQLTQGQCAVLPGLFLGEGTACEPGACPEPTEACCFVGGGCIDFEVEQCDLAGGFTQGPGTTCNDVVCFATGACCQPDGSCTDGLSPGECDDLQGVFQGADSLCSAADCPDPTGGCCFATGFCVELTEANCAQGGVLWGGPLTSCADDDGNGTADVCEPDSCPADLSGDQVVNASDLAQMLGAWGANPGHPADITGDDVVDAFDLAQLLGVWGPCP